ncbi:MFS transporter [Bacillus cereus]|uniref:MFS transporter n=1 Tax=Bacillus cereus group TaxID=86661 RepID=UPI0005342356|nr:MULTISPECIES: MFS transporter [Bacillus cereus group]HDR7530827.1 MFS transporter [Bacillus anthracis]KWU63060.1 MFS transporter [Bacillus cereus]MCQ0955082.1 MFS transporter [Bacillus cereus]MCU4921290.1 MFS transporter [Bacillus cereus]MCU5692551.1 MFS transporter [Bacillus cereus]
MVKLNNKTNFLIFILAISCGSLAANIYYAQPIVQFIAKDLNISSDLSGLLTTLTQIGYGLGLFFIVPMADLFKSKKIIGILIGLTILSLMGTLISTNGNIFLLLTTIIGIGACAAQMLVPLTMRIVPIEETGKYVGKVMSGLLIGIMIARPLSIGIADWFGWRMVFLASLIVLVVVLLLIIKFLPNYEVISTSNMRYPYLIASMVKLLIHTSPLQQRAFYHACLFATFSLYWTVMPILLRAEPLHFSNNEIALFGFVAIAGALLTPTIGKIADKGHIFTMTNVSMMLVLLSVILLFFVQDHSLFSMILILISGICVDIGVAGNLLLGQKVIFSLNPEIRNRLNGLYMTIFFLGGAFGSWIGSYTYYKFNSEVTLLIGVAFPLIALFVHFIKNNTKKLSETKSEFIS